MSLRFALPSLRSPALRAPVLRAPAMVRMSSNRAPSGPNPLDAPTLAALKQRWKQARLAKDANTATVLGYAEKTKAQANQKAPSVIKMLQKGIKKRTDAAKVFRNAKPEPRPDLAEKEDKEIALLQSLLPKEE